MPGVAAGLIAGLLAVVTAISLAALIFSGDLSAHLARGIGLTLFGAVVMEVVVTLTTSVRGAIAIPQDATAAVLALVAAGIAAGMRPAAGRDEVYWTVVAAIAITSLATGLFFLLLGRFKLGGFIRFVPYPVVGGFLAGTGWLLVRGAINLMTGSPVGLGELPRMFRIAAVPLWLPGVVFGLVLLAAVRRGNTVVVMPVLAAATAAFYGVLLLTNTSLVDAGTRGWLLGPFPLGALWTPPTPAALARVDWPAIAAQVTGLGTVLILGAIALLLNATGLELGAREDIDLDRELESAGLANLVAGLGGAPLGYHTLSLSTLQHRLGASGRLPGILAAGVCAVALLFGAGALAFFPRPVLGGFLFFLGLSFLVEWLYDARRRLPRTDYVLVLMIFAAIGAVNFLAGVGLGVAVAVALFVVNYSRIGVVKHAFTGANYRSSVERPRSNRDALDHTGDQTLILQLQGYIFFGTARTLVTRVRQRLEHPTLAPLRYVVFDLRFVHGLDSSAVASFERMKQWAGAKGFQMVFTQLAPIARAQLERGGLAEGRDGMVRFFPTLDHGVEWCEEEILIAARVPAAADRDALPVQLSRVLPESVDVERLMAYLERLQVGEGDYLVRQGDPSDALYFVESGQLSAQLELPGGGLTRLTTMRSGTVVGEIPMYIGGTRTASVVAVTPCTLYRLSAGRLRAMEHEAPDLAAALHRLIARRLAERLAALSRTLEAALR